MYVLIADAAASVRSALRFYVEQCRTDATVVEVACLEEMRELVADTKVDVALVDWHLPQRGGAEALRYLRTAHPHTCIIVLSGRPEARNEITGAAADGFVSKGDPPDELHALLERAVECEDRIPTEGVETCRPAKAALSEASSVSRQRSYLLSGASRA